MAMVGGRAFRELKGSRMAAKMAKPLSGVNMLNKGTVVIGSVVAASTGFLQGGPWQDGWHPAPLYNTK